MKIVFLQKRFSEGGELMHMLDLSSELVKLGNQVFILTGGLSVIFEQNERMKSIHSHFEQRGVKVIYMSFPDSTMNIFKYMFSLIKGIIQTYLFCKKNEIDVVHVHRPIMTVIPKILNLKFVYTVHNMNLNRVFWCFKPTYQIAISQGTFDEVMNKFHYKPDEISIINNGVSKDFAQLATVAQKNAIKDSLGIDRDTVLIGFVGRITYEKGVDVLLNAIPLVRDRVKCEFKVILLGGFERSKEFIEKIIIKNNLEDIVNIYDFQNPKKFYDIYDVFVLPSRSEGFPLTVVEAMLSGCCVVRTNTGGAEEQIVNGESGFIFQNENDSELSDILVKLLSSEEYRQNISDKGRKRALDYFTSERMAKETQSVYNHVKLNW